MHLFSVTLFLMFSGGRERVIGNKWVKRFFSNKGSHRANVKLVEGDKLLQDDSEVVKEPV